MITQVVAPGECQARPRRALAMLKRVNAYPELLRERDPYILGTLPSVHRTAWEVFLIAYAMWLTRNRAYTPFTREKLAHLFDGADVEGLKGTTGRNIQFEMSTAAFLMVGGVEVYPGEPDLPFRLRYHASGRRGQTHPEPEAREVTLASEKGD